MTGLLLVGYGIKIFRRREFCSFLQTGCGIVLKVDGGMRDENWKITGYLGFTENCEPNQAG